MSSSSSQISSSNRDKGSRVVQRLSSDWTPKSANKNERFSKDSFDLLDEDSEGRHRSSPVTLYNASQQLAPVQGPESAPITHSPEPQIQHLGLEQSSTFEAVKEKPIGWLDLPKKGQLAVLTLARFSEPLSERSLAAYIFYQLRSFDPSLPDSTITSQGGLLTAAFAGAQLFTAVWWGRAADSPRIGRKMVILIGLMGSATATLGVGFSKTFTQAMAWRILAGALNGNTGVMRTMISEMIEERKFQSRAFLLLPMCFNTGIIIGPIIGGFLADPVHNLPKVFGPGSIWGGREGVAWMKYFPYALPNVFSAVIIFMSALGVVLGLNETHPLLRQQRDRGRQLGKYLYRLVFRRRNSHEYQILQTEETEMQPLSQPSWSEDIRDSDQRPKRNGVSSLDGQGIRTSSKGREVTEEKRFWSIMTRNVLFTLLSHHFLALHVSTFNALVYLFLPAPRSTAEADQFTLRFTGGLGLSTAQVGLATSIIGLIGLPLTILAYPPINSKLGTLRSYRFFLPFCGLAYSTIPFLALFASRSKLLWPLLTAVWVAQVLGRTFSLPSTVILVNNSSPSREVLGTVHGLAQSVSSAGRMLGPTIGGWGLGLGLKNNCVGAVWWAMTCIVVLNWSLLWMIWEGDGRGGRAE